MRLSFATCTRAFALLTLLVAPVGAQRSSTESDSLSLERLATLGRLWGAVRYFHPDVAQSGARWDSSVIAAIPRVRAARSRQEYRAALESVLATLGDPATTLLSSDVGSPIVERHPAGGTWVGDSIVVITITNQEDWNGAIALLQRQFEAIARARGVVFDLRTNTLPDASTLGFVFDYSGIAVALARTPLAAPDEQRRMHAGFAPEAGGTSGGYFSGAYIVNGVAYGSPRTSRDKSVVFLVSERTVVPSVAVTLQSLGLGRIVLDGARLDATALGSNYAIALADSVVVRLRTGQFVIGGKPVHVATDTIIRPSARADSDGPLETAVALARQPVAAARAQLAGTQRSGSGAAPTVIDSDRQPAFPDSAARIFAGLKTWYVIEQFYPYRHLMREDWAATLRHFLPRLEAARDSLEYGLALAELATHLHDSHVFVRSTALGAYFGAAVPGIVTQIIDGLPVVERIVNDSATRSSGLHVGDVIVAIDGESFSARSARLGRYLAASTPQAAAHRNMQFALRGEEGSTATLRVRDGEGRERECRLPRKRAYVDSVTHPRVGPIMQLLPGNIGYVDLDRLQLTMVDSMFETFRGTRAIIFDLRGYPFGTGWTIASRLAVHDGRIDASFSNPIRLSPDSNDFSVQTGVDRVPVASNWHYRGTTLMLIDERNVSQAESTGQLLRAANGTRFVGSPTVGADGDVTALTLPGGIAISFTGHEVRHPDGSQLQRVGLVPDVRVRPTVKGIRNGRDEVLEKALDVLNKR